MTAAGPIKETSARLGGPVILAVAPNGPVLSSVQHSSVPITPTQIAREVALCVDAGASIVHLHVRDRDGAHTLNADAYHDAIHAIRETVGDRVLLQMTTEACGKYKAFEQVQAVRDVRPESCSLAVREFSEPNLTTREFANFLAWCRREAILCQFILYTPACVSAFLRLRNAGAIPFDRCFILFVAGDKKARVSSGADLLPFLTDDLHEHDWMACGFGHGDYQVAMTAIGCGGHVRVGYENNTLLPSGAPAKTNDQIIDAVGHLCEVSGRPIANVDYARTVLRPF